MFGKEFFAKTFKEDNEGVEGTVDPLETPIVEQAVEGTPTVPATEPVVTPTEKVDVPNVEVPTKYNVDGVDVSLEDIREWKKGNMRQQDYTRKTQELANQRREFETTKLLGEDLTPKTSETQRIEKLEYDAKAKELDSEITRLKTLYPDFDEIKVLNESEKRGIYDDFEFVYKALRDDVKPGNMVDVEAVKNQAIEEYKTRIATELLNNTNATAGSIITNEAGVPATDYADMLTSDEKAYCNKRGLSFKDYSEQKDKVYL